MLDLGIARDLSQDPTTTTRAGLIRGTPAYMAPERFFGKPATPATDIYELAVVLYVTLVGSLPWGSVDDPTERLRPAAPATRGVVLPPRLTTTLMRALSGQAAERPRSASEFAGAVTEALSPESRAALSSSRTGEARSRTAPMAAVSSPPSDSGRVVPKTLMAPVAAVTQPPSYAAPSAVPYGSQGPAASGRPAGVPLPAPAMAPSSSAGGHVAPPGKRPGIPAWAVAAAAVGFVVLVGGAMTGFVALRHRRGDMPCCRQLNAEACANSPCPTPPVDVELMKRNAPFSYWSQIDKNCCAALENMRRVRARQLPR